MNLRELFSAITILVLFPATGNAQDSGRIIDSSTDQKEVLAAFDIRLLGKEGKFFLDDDWGLGEIHFRSGLVVKDFPVRYDIQYNLLEIRIKDVIKVLPLGKIEHYEAINPQNGEKEFYKSCRDYRTADGPSLSGLCKYYTNGKYTLITNYNYSLKDPDYIKPLDVGNKERKLFIMDDSYLVIDNTAYPLTSSKKEIISFFGSDSDKAKTFIDEEKLNPRRMEDLRLIVDHLSNDD